jgi:hypothetical protein
VPRPKLFVSKRRLQREWPDPKKLSCVRVPVNMFYVAWKLSTIEKRHQRYFGLQEQRPKLRKTVLGSSPSEGGFCCSETKHDRRTKTKNKIICFGEEITGTKDMNPKTILSSSLGENIGFRDDVYDDNNNNNNNNNFSIIFSDTNRMITFMKTFGR